MGRGSRSRQQDVQRTHTSLDVRSDGKQHGVQFRTGPLPVAAEFGEYEHVLPGSAERLLAMAESEQRHRHGLETEDAVHDRKKDNRGLAWGGTLTVLGMVLAFLSLGGVLGAGVWLISTDRPVGGYGSLVVAVVAIVTVFVNANKSARPAESTAVQKGE